MIPGPSRSREGLLARKCLGHVDAICLDRLMPAPESASGTVWRMEVRSLGYQTDLTVRRLAGSEIVDHDDHLVVRTLANPEFYWGNFILVGSPLVPGDAERWLAVFSSEFPEARHMAIGVDGSDDEVGDVAGFLAAGMAVDISTVLTASSLRHPTSPVPGCRRPLLSDEDWGQVKDLRLALALDEGHDSAQYRQFLEGRVDAARHIAEAGHGVYFGAFVENRMVSSLGVVLDGSGLARFQNVETHPAHRRRGLASALVSADGLHALGALGARLLVIVAEPDGPAIGIYRTLGFVDVEHQVGLVRAAPPS